MNARLLAVLLALPAARLAAQTPAPAAAPAPPAVFAIVGATIHPVAGPDIPNGTLVVRDGKIASVAPGAAPPAGLPVVDGTGRHVYPSLFPPLTDLGLEEISAVRQTLDVEELGEINPAARADVAMNLDSELLPVARSGGVLLAGITPGGGIISGSVAAMKLDGWTREDATLRAPAAITVEWPSQTIDRSPDASRSVKAQQKARDEAVEKLKKAFRDARAYGKARAAEGAAGVPKHDFDPKLAALMPAIDGAVPVVVHAQRLAQIRDAVKWAAAEKLRLVVWGGADAWRMAGELASASVPVIVESPLDLPQREDEPYDVQFSNAGLLDRAGVRVIFNENGAANVRNYPQLAATAVAYGFPRDKAVAALTLEPARVLGVDGRVGSLETGKDATFILTDGDILDLRSHVVGAYVDGRALDLTDRQKRLYERYRNRPRPAGSSSLSPGGEEGRSEGATMNFLFKEEPTHYSYDDLARDGKTSWTGVKNPLAQKHLRSVKRGDRIFYYHTGDEKAVVGIAKAAGDAYPDPKDKAGKLHAVDVVPVKKLARPVTLAEIKASPAFRDFPLVRISRLSVMPVSDREWASIEKLASS